MSLHSCTWNWRCPFIQFHPASPGVSSWLQTTLAAGGSKTAKCILFWDVFLSFQTLSRFKAGTSSRTLNPIVILPRGAHICNVSELIIIFPLVLKIILKWERLPHRLKELKRQSKVLELFPNQCNNHIPPEAAVNDLSCGEGLGRNLLYLVFSPPGVALTGNWFLA